jgi:hypothetical protein
MTSTRKSPPTPILEVFEKAFGEIYGKPCWGVRAGYGSFLTMEFGKPHLEVREPIVASKDASVQVRKELVRRGVFVHGEWHLWIYCCDWEVLSKGKRIGDSSTKLKVRRAADCLDGQKLTRFSMSHRNVQCVFEFDLGATLRTRAYDKESEQWFLYEPSQKVLSLWADGGYKHIRSDVSENKAWKPLQAKRG